MSEKKDERDRKITVTVDNEQTKLLAEELARKNQALEKERKRVDYLTDKIADKEVNEDSEEKEANLADLKLQAYQKFKQPFFLDAPDKATLSAMLTNYINQLQERANPSEKPSGSAPANAQQYGFKPDDLYTHKFYDSQNMIEELRRLSHEGNPKEKAEAQTYLEEIFKKFVLDKRSAPTRPEPSHNPNAPENLTELDLVKKDGFLTPRDKEDGDLGKLQKKWREERQRKREGKSE